MQNNQSLLEKKGKNAPLKTAGTKEAGVLSLMENYALDHDEGHQNLMEAARELLS